MAFHSRSRVLYDNPGGPTSFFAFGGHPTTVPCGFTWQDEATPALAACTTPIPMVPVKREITKEHATRKAEKRFRMSLLPCSRASWRARQGHSELRLFQRSIRYCFQDLFLNKRRCEGSHTEPERNINSSGRNCKKQANWHDGSRSLCTRFC